MKRLLSQMWQSASEHNRRNVLKAVGVAPGFKLLDVGCWDGEWTMRLAKGAGTSDVDGVEIVESAIASAQERGVTVVKADLAAALPIPNDTYDIVHANQVIEHVPDLDIFMSEICRVLRPGGKAVISTENGSSWANVFATMMGWQMFSATNISSKAGGLGNPFALHRGDADLAPSMRHKTIFNYRGLVEFSQAHGFECVKAFGAGYFPLPTGCGAIDVRHAHFITLELRKLPLRA